MGWFWTRWTVLYVIIFAVENSTAQIEGYGYVNVALGKPTKQSSTVYSGSSSKAVDGNRNPDYSLYSCTHTNDETAKKWWAVDLYDSFNIHSVAITNRNIFSTRLANFFVYISNKNPLPIPSLNGSFLGQLCVHHPGPLGQSGPYTLPCNHLVSGRYVYLYKPPDSTALALCEVEVMAEAEISPVYLQEKKFNQWTGRKSILPPFYSTTINISSNLKCAAKCLSRKEKVTTVVQFEMSTKRCECIQKSKLTTSGTDYTVDAGWIMMEAVTN